MCDHSNHNINMEDNKIAMITRPLPTILIQISTERGIRFKGDVVSDINILISKTGQEFRRDYNIIVSRNNLQVLFFEVKHKLRIGLTNNNTEVVGGIVLLVTSHQFDDTSSPMTDTSGVDRQMCLLQFLQLLRR